MRDASGDETNRICMHAVVGIADIMLFMTLFLRPFWSQTHISIDLCCERCLFSRALTHTHTHTHLRVSAIEREDIEIHLNLLGTAGRHSRHISPKTTSDDIRCCNVPPKPKCSESRNIFIFRWRVPRTKLEHFSLRLRST